MERKVISKWSKTHNGKEMEMVVYHWVDNGGTKRSRTAHEPVKQ